jgi:hypothetical protein
MHKFVAAAAQALAAFFAPGLHAQADASGAQDDPSIARFPGMAIVSATQHDFGAHAFPLKDGTKDLEGRIWEIQYAPKGGPRENRRVELVKQ